METFNCSVISQKLLVAMNRQSNGFSPCDVLNIIEDNHSTLLA
jgi:hypothetical protein